MRQRLQLCQIGHPGIQVPFHQLAQDLQPHLQADKALQGSIVEITGDAHALQFARLLGHLFRLLHLFAQALDFPCLPSLVHRRPAGQHTRHDHRPLEHRGTFRQHYAKRGAHRHNHHHFHRAVKCQGFAQQEQVESAGQPQQASSAVADHDQKEKRVAEQRQQAQYAGATPGAQRNYHSVHKVERHHAVEQGRDRARQEKISGRRGNGR